MKKGYTYPREPCHICGEIVAGNRYIKHLNKAHLDRYDPPKPTLDDALEKAAQTRANQARVDEALNDLYVAYFVVGQDSAKTRAKLEILIDAYDDWLD